MQIELLSMGETAQGELSESIADYAKRINRFAKFSLSNKSLPKRLNKLPASQRKEKEGAIMLEHMATYDYCVLLDEKGKALSSKHFAAFLQDRMNMSTRKLLFVVGGPYGFSSEVYKAANIKLSLSAMTFNHQMVRLFFTEQLYRALSILAGEPYHNE